MAAEYLSGDADAAVAFFAGRKVYQLPSDTSTSQAISRTSGPVAWLFATEIGMRLRTFGKYAKSATLDAGKTDVVGLNGQFELISFSTYRTLEQSLRAARAPDPPRERGSPEPPKLSGADHERLETFIRQWHVVTISHCARWQLDCAETLFASAQLYFGETADVLVLASSRAEARGASAEAQELLRRALSVDADHVSAHLRLGRLLAGAGRLADAARELTRALDLARAEHNAGAAYFALTSLADLDARAGRAASARSRRADAAALKAFDHPSFAGLAPATIYRAGLFYEQPYRIAALRTLAR